MLPRSALKYEHIFDLVLRIDITPHLKEKDFEEKVLQAIQCEWEIREAKVKGDTVIFRPDDDEVWSRKCEASQWRHNYAVRLNSEDAFFIQVGSSSGDAAHEVRFLFGYMGDYHHMPASQIWELCGTPDSLDPWRVTVEKMHVKFALRGLSLEDVLPQFSGYSKDASETIVMPDGTVVGYQVGRSLPGRFPMTKCHDGMRRDERRSRFQWKPDRELSFRDQRPEDGELPAISINYFLPRAASLSDLHHSPNPLAGVDLVHAGDGPRPAVACWNQQLAWSKVFAELSGLFGG